MTKSPPGDSVSFNIKVDNTDTDIAAKYRVAYNVTSGFVLAEGLDVSIGGVFDNTEKYKSYVGAWDSDLTKTYAVTVSLPQDAGNLYMGLSASMSFAVEAVQANGAPETSEPSFEPLVTTASTEEELLAAIANKGVVRVENDIELSTGIYVKDDLYLVGNGATISLAKGEKFAPIYINNLTEETNVEFCGVNLVNKYPHASYARAISVYNNQCKINLLIRDSYVEAEHYPIVDVAQNENLNVTIKNSTVKGYCAFYGFSSNSKFMVENSNLISVNGFPKSDYNNFSTVKFNKDAKNVDISIKNSVISAEATTGNMQRLFTFGLNTTGNVVCENCQLISNNKAIEASELFVNLTEDENSIFNDYVLFFSNADAERTQLAEVKSTVNGVEYTPHFTQPNPKA